MVLCGSVSGLSAGFRGMSRGTVPPRTALATDGPVWVHFWALCWLHWLNHLDIVVLLQVLDLVVLIWVYAESPQVSGVRRGHKIPWSWCYDGCETPNTGDENRTLSSSRAASTLNHWAITPIPSSSWKLGQVFIWARLVMLDARQALRHWTMPSTYLIFLC